MYSTVPERELEVKSCSILEDTVTGIAWWVLGVPERVPRSEHQNCIENCFNTRLLFVLTWQGLSLRWLLPASICGARECAEGEVTVSHEGHDGVTVSSQGGSTVTESSKTETSQGHSEEDSGTGEEAERGSRSVPSLFPSPVMDALRVLALTPEQVSVCADLLQQVRTCCEGGMAPESLSPNPPHA